MRPVKLPLNHARRLMVASQKLAGPALEPSDIIEHLGYVQIDTISVVERAHHHVFWSRNQKYKPEDLSDLIDSRNVFEYWSHAASFLPMKDYRYSLPLKREFQKRESSWYPKDLKLMKQVLTRIRKEGPLRSKDFETAKKGKSGWWDWKPAKKALERLFLEGKLEITHREGFQKVYDLPENVIPENVDTTFPSETEYARYLIQRTLQHHGLATASEMAYMCNARIKRAVLNSLNEMVAAGEVSQVFVEEINESYFALQKTIDKIPRVGRRIHILSPFDNLTIQRSKLLTLFNYDYKIECYVPASKRQYGYFSLPVLQGSRFVARIDCKADRKNQQLIIQSLHYEKEIDRGLLQDKLESKMLEFAQFNGCKELVFARK